MALIAGCLTGTPEDAAAAWLTAVCGDPNADEAIMEDDVGVHSLSDGPTAAPPADEDQRFSSPSVPSPAPSPDALTSTTPGADDGEAISARIDEAGSAGAAAMWPRAPHLRGPKAGTGILHAEPGEHAEAPTGAVVERPTLCPDGGG